VRSAEAPMDVCIHRWIDQTIFTAPYPTPPHATPPSPRAAYGPSFSFSMPLVAIEITGGEGRGAGIPRCAVGPRCSLAMGLFVVSRLHLYLWNRDGAAGREDVTGWTEIESPRDLCRPCGIN